MAEAQQQGTRRIGRFEVLRELGRGSQGAVCLARDPTLSRLVAIKTLHLKAHRDPAAVQQLLQEACTAGQLTHPNIVPVFEVGSADGEHYVVFECVPGQTLRARLAQGGAMAPPAAVVMMSQVLAGIAHAHTHDVVHGDISPANILVSPTGLPRVTDFGIAALLRAGTAPGQGVAGTVRYMAPERFRPAPPDARADVFALGLIFYEMLTGTPAFDADNDYALIYQLSYVAALPPSQRQPRIDPALDAIVLQALDKVPERRFADAGAMKQALDRIRVGHAAGPAQELRQESVHATVDFLLRRMRHRSDFPMLSARFAEINRLTADDSPGSHRKLVNFVLQDFALSSKLLRLVNQAAHGRSGVTSVSTAIALLGLEQVRAAATGLMLASPAERGPPRPELAEAITGAFVAGVTGWNLGKLQRLDHAEELFVCSMFSRLGEILSIHYFPEESAEIRRQLLQAPGDEATVAREVLGLSFDELGIEIARRWKFPEVILQAQAPLPAGVLEPGRERAQRLAHCAGLARELCLLARSGARSQADAAFDALLARYARAVPCTRAQLQPLLTQSVAMAQQYCSLVGIDSARSALVEGLSAWSAPPPAAKPAAPRAPLSAANPSPAP